MDKNTEILAKNPRQTAQKAVSFTDAPAIFFPVLHLFWDAFMRHSFFPSSEKRVSEAEQRKLASFPSLTLQTLWNGDFTAGLNIYYSDNFIMRDALGQGEIRA